MDDSSGAPLNQKLDKEDWKHYVHALDLFNRKYFWECHEVLEDVWMTKQPPLKIFLQGIIQAAASFYHVLNENPKGAIKLSMDSRQKLEGFLPRYQGLNVEELVNSLKFFESESTEIMQSQKTQFTFERIPVLEIPTMMS